MKQMANRRRHLPIGSRYVLHGACMVLMALLISAPSVQAADKGIESLRQMGKAFASVAKKVSPAVVFIKVEKKIQSQPTFEFFSPFGDEGFPFGDEFFRRFFGIPFHEQPRRRLPEPPRRQRRILGQGSGFIVSDDGYILTNNHVVGDADKVTVRLSDGREYTATIIGTDPQSDVAVIKIDAEDLPVLALGDSDALEVGEWVIAIGNPFGLSHTLTAGVVSAKGRSGVGITDYEDFIQTDAAINPGNSGGPLVNLDGKAVGMNTAIFTRSGGYMGIGFAIPINMVKAIRDQLIEHGHVTRGYLGIAIQDLTPDLAKTFELENQKGILVAEVTEDSPADKAGLKAGDVIVEMNGKPVSRVSSFRNRVSLTPPGTKIKLTVFRDGKQKTLSVKVGKMPEGGLAAGGPSHALEQLGLTVRTLTRELARQYGYWGETGVLVTAVEAGSVAELAGIRAGMLIKEVNRKRVKTAEQFRQALEETPAHGVVLLLVKDGKYSHYVALRMQ